MGKKKNSNHGDMGRFESTYGMAIRPEIRPLPDGLKFHHTASGGDPHYELRGFVPYKLAHTQMVPLPNQMAVGDTKLAAGWINHQPYFLILGCEADITAVRSLPILVLRPASFLSNHGALVSLELDLHESIWPVGHWTLTFNPCEDAHLAFLLSLIHRPAVSVILAPVPLDEMTITHTVYRPIDPIGQQISAALDRAHQHIERLGKVEAEATEIHFLYHQLHQND